MSVAAPDDVDEAFYALIAADPDLVRAEFEELIDAAWDPPEPDEASPPQRRRPRPAPVGERTRCGRGRRACGVPRRQERSPPRRT
ncbi:hypothetical protein [Cryptosporangium aurantiacum]|uniref:hypothetical protein n=1 Tax=Cryptosporangium aurantiacum TaxID=134849 RepID=UPI001160EE85|nr:hypothetical protein [Cryptosporangium aurantiacum]